MPIRDSASEGPATQASRKALYHSAVRVAASRPVVRSLTAVPGRNRWFGSSVLAVSREDWGRLLSRDVSFRW